MTATSQATTTMVCADAPLGWVQPVADLREVSSPRGELTRPAVVQVDRRYYEPRVLDLGPPMSN